jgi:hypothetical protein
MTIFSHDTLQKLIDQNHAAAITSAEQTRSHVSKLNAMNEQALAFEWEVVLLNVLGRIGNVEHERSCGFRRPDIYFRNSATSEGFIADIVTISDVGSQDENPVDLLTLELEQRITSQGLNIYNFSVHIGTVPQPYRPHARIKLKIPRRGSFHKEIFNASFMKYLKAIASEPGLARDHTLKTQELDVVIEYRPGQASFKFQSAAFDIHPPMKQNPLLYALKRKARVLKEAEYDGAKGIVVCDGGSSMFFFRRSDVLHNGSEKVVEDFLRQSETVSFVLLVTVEVLFDPFPQRVGHKVLTELYLNEKLNVLSEELRDTLNSLDQLFPGPEVDARSAISNIKRRRFLPEAELFRLPTSEQAYNSRTITVTAPLQIRKWSNPIKRRTIRHYASKLTTEVVPTEDERREASEAIANGAEGVDDVNNILAPASLQKRVLELHPRMIPVVASGQADILYDPFTFQVIAAFRTKE